MILRSSFYLTIVIFSFNVSCLLAQNNTNSTIQNSQPVTNLTSINLPPSPKSFPAEGGYVHIDENVNEKKTTKSNIVARKGVGSPFVEPSTNLSQNVSVHNNKNITLDHNITSANNTTKSVNITTTSTTPKPLKPLILYSLDEESDIIVPPKTNIANNNKNQNNLADQKPYLENKESNSISGLNIGIQIQSHGHPDYIVPVVITIFAVPIMVGFTVFLVRKLRDHWDKRHYRRMDFLIDGMYND